MTGLIYTFNSKFDNAIKGFEPLNLGKAKLVIQKE